jgi:hypothetical protein
MMKIRMESDDGIPVNINGTVIVGETAFTVTSMDWERHGGCSPLRTRAVIAETGPYFANCMSLRDDGLTLTGLIHKILRECCNGVAPGSEAQAERIAGHLSHRIGHHLSCRDKEDARLRADLKERCERIDCLTRQAEKDKAEITRLLRIIDSPPSASRGLNRRDLECEIFRQEEVMRGLKAEAEGKTKVIEALQFTIKALTEGFEKQTTEVKNLQSALGKKRGRILRLGKRIAAQNEEIHRLNELLKAIRIRYEGDNVKSFARMADPLHTNCRCWVNPEVGVDGVIRAIAKDVEDRAKRLTPFDGVMSFNGVPIADVRFDVSFTKPDARPYAVLCGQCGQALAEEQAYCDKCGADQRSCSTCVHRTPTCDRSGVCGQVDCEGNDHWEGE